jgi:hypothetical protein
MVVNHGRGALPRLRNAVVPHVVGHRVSRLRGPSGREHARHWCEPLAIGGDCNRNRDDKEWCCFIEVSWSRCGSPQLACECAGHSSKYDFRLVPLHVHFQKADAIDALLGDQIVEGRCFHR